MQSEPSIQSYLARLASVYAARGDYDRALETGNHALRVVEAAAGEQRGGPVPLLVEIGDYELARGEREPAWRGPFNWCVCCLRSACWKT